MTELLGGFLDFRFEGDSRRQESHFDKLIAGDAEHIFLNKNSP